MKTIKRIIATKEYQQLKRLILGYLYELAKLKLYNLFHSEKSSIIDVVDDRDIMYEEIEIVMGEVPTKFGKRNIENIQNQRHSPIFPGSSCGPHGVSHALETSGMINAPTGPEIAQGMKDKGMMHSWGSYLSDNPKYALEKGYITGYARVTTKEQIMKHLSTGQAVIIGSNKLKFNWNIEKQRYQYYPASSFGHLWTTMIWYDEEGVWCVDSLVLNNLPKLLLWKDLDHLFPSRFAIFIDKRFSKLQEIKKDTLKLVELVKKTHPELPQPAQMIRVQKTLNRKFKDKKLVQVGFRLAMGMNIEDYML